MNRTKAISQIGVAGSRKAQARSDSTLMAPLTSNTGLKPKRRRMPVVAGFIIKLPANTAITSMPE